MMGLTSRKILGLAVGLTLTGAVHAASLTGAEIAQIENEFGITLSSNDIENLSAVVYPTNSPQWRSDAYSRIDTSRKATLDVQVVDMNGDPVEGATVAVKMKSNDFNFGGTFSAKDFSNADGNLNMSTNTYQDRLLSMFNAVGLNNGFKPKLTSIHDDVPAVTNWTAANNLPLRGHLLIWPGSGDVATMDDPGSVAGVDYGKHLSTASTSAYASYDVIGAVDIYKASSRTPADKAALKAVVDAEIAEWAGTWNVYEWDVINETLSNQLLMEILGEDQMAEWFKIADTNKISADTKLLINDYQIISAMSESRTPGWYTTRRDNYMANIDQIISDGGQIDRIGFQSRIKQERRDPQLIYDRLEEWGNTYGLEMVGTEFEVVDSASTNDWKYYFYTEEERAQITEEMMTQYFSHPLVTGFFAWNTINDDVEALVDYSGNPTLQGLVWYYLHRIRYNTDTTLASGLEGRTGLRAFKGDYDLMVDYKGQAYSAALVHTNDQSIVIMLDTVIADNQNTAAVIDEWNYAGLTNGSGLSSAISTGGASTPDYPLASIQNETVRWQSDGVTDSLYRNIGVSSSAGANTGLYQLSMDYLDADFSASAAVSNGSGRVAIGIRTDSNVDVNFRLFFNSGDGSAPEFRLQVVDDLANNQTIATFPGTTLDHLHVRAVYDFDDMGSAGSYQVYYRFDGGSEVAAYTTGQLPTGFALDKFRLTTQTYNGGVNWSAGDRVFTDNLVLRSLGDPPPVFFTVDPISRPAADADISYTGQSIFGTASNAVSYSIVAGPAWLNIAENGDLSGTPTTDDVGANSWIVQASSGIETDTAVLHITVNGAGGGGPGGNISFAYESADLPDAPDTDDTTFANISVQAGDVVAISTSPNKSFAVNPLALVWSGTEGVDGSTTTVKPDDLDNRTSYVFYTQIINTGTYTFIVDGNGTGLTARSKLFVLRANSGIIGIGDTATLSGNTSTPGMSYDFSPETLPASAIAIESFATKAGGTLTADAAYTEDFDTATRHLLHSTSVSGSTWSKTHACSSGPEKFSGAGAVFYEQASGAGNTPPVFNSDPVVESDAYEGSAYNATIADKASDGDSDPMNFNIVSGPLWLNMATNGVLTGTPLSGDIGLNKWKMSVTDGIATNFATLEIGVVDPVPPVASPDRTRLHPTNNYNVLFVAIDDMRPLINAYGETEPLLPSTPNMDRLAESGVMFANAHCQQPVCNASRASLLTGLRPDTTMCWKLDTFFRDQVPDVITLPQHFGANGYRVHGIGKIFHSTNATSQDDPLSWNEGWSSSATAYTWYETDKAALEDAGTNKVSATDAGEVDRLGDPITDEAYNDGYAAAQGVAKIAEYAASYESSNTPFFLAVGFQKPHMPFNAPKAYWDLYNPSEIDLTGYTGIRQMPIGSNKFTAPYGGEPSAFLDITGTVDNGMPTATEARHLIHGYLACVSYIDTQIGKLIDALEDPDGNPATDDSIADNTIIVLWGDHGFHLGDHNGFWAKHSNYEISTRVPLIISTPGMPDLGAAGTRSVGLVELVDLYPTLVDLCSLPTPSQPTGQALQGTTFLPLLEDPAQPWKKAVFSQFQRNINDNEPGDVPVNNSGTGMGYTIRTERYRYTEWWVTESTDETDRHIIKAGITEPGHIELYDYITDPREATNLASNVSYAGLMAELSAMLSDSNPVIAGDGWTLPEVDAPDAYPLDAAVWKTNYLSPGRVMSELDLDGDPDGDTIINRFEYKFGTHPFVAEASPVFYDFDAGGLYITYPDVEARTNVLMEVTTTTNLVGGSWAPSGVTETNEGQQGNATIKTGSVPVVDPIRFLRLEASDL